MATKYLMMWRRHFDTFEDMPDEVVGQIVKAMGREMFQNGDPYATGADRLLLTPFLNDARTAREKAGDKSAKNSNSGKLGAEARWGKNPGADGDKTPTPPPSFDPGSSRLEKLRTIWNDSEGLPPCRRVPANMRNLGDLVSTLSSFSDDEAAAAIRNFAELRQVAVDSGTRVPETFESFIAKLDRWTDEADPASRYKKAVTPMTAGGMNFDL